MDRINVKLSDQHIILSVYLARRGGVVTFVTGVCHGLSDTCNYEFANQKSIMNLQDKQIFNYQIRKEMLFMKRKLAITIEVIPVIAAILSIGLIVSPYSSNAVRGVINISTLLAFMGFIFFFVGRKMDKEDNMVRILSIAALLSGVCMVAFYIVAIMVFGL